MRISNPSLPSVSEAVQVDELALDADTLTIAARTIAACPHCGRWSARVHSSYWRSAPRSYHPRPSPRRLQIGVSQSAGGALLGEHAAGLIGRIARWARGFAAACGRPVSRLDEQGDWLLRDLGLERSDIQSPAERLDELRRGMPCQ